MDSRQCMAAGDRPHEDTHLSKAIQIRGETQGTGRRSDMESMMMAIARPLLEATLVRPAEL